MTAPSEFLRGLRVLELGDCASGMSAVDRDGVTRVILSHDDPGHANWIDLQGHTRGWLYFRSMFTRRVPSFASRVVDRPSLDEEIGDVATRVSPDQRRAELRRRREANLRRFPA